MRAASNGSPIPLIWSRELVATRRVFRNENPFEVRKFNFFQRQLPRTSNLTELLGGGSMSCTQCDTCAVVGASGSLLNRQHGPLIDAHQVVLRPNWLRIKGYEHLVGTRTDLNLFFGLENMIDQFDQYQRKLPPEKRAFRGLVTNQLSLLTNRRADGELSGRCVWFPGVLEWCPPPPARSPHVALAA